MQQSTDYFTYIGLTKSSISKVKYNLFIRYFESHLIKLNSHVCVLFTKKAYNHCKEKYYVNAPLV